MEPARSRSKEFSLGVFDGWGKILASEVIKEIKEEGHCLGEEGIILDGGGECRVGTWIG